MSSELPSVVVSRLMFDYEVLSVDEMRGLAIQLPRKILRWIAIHHPDNRSRLLFFDLTNVSVGEETVINAGVTIYDEYEPRVTIGRRVAIATGVTIIASSNPNNSELAQFEYVRSQLVQLEHVTIGDDVWVGAGATLLPGVSLGKGSIVGAGAVVTKPVEAFTIVAGVPARVVRRLQ